MVAPGMSTVACMVSPARPLLHAWLAQHIHYIQHVEHSMSTATISAVVVLMQVDHVLPVVLDSGHLN